MSVRPFFSDIGINVETYDARVAVEMPDYIRRDVAFYISHAEETGGPVLELGCGTGRVCWELARAGFNAVGLDVSDPMICAAEAKRWKNPEQVGERMTFVQADMTAFDLSPHKFPLIIAPFRSFQSLITPDAQRRALECIHRHLEPEGWAIIDLFDPQLERCQPMDTTHRRRHETIHDPISDNMIEIETMSRRTNPVTQIVSEVWRFTELDGSQEIVRQEEESIMLRWTYRREMRYLLELCGFTVEAEYSDFKGSPPTYGKEQVWVARKV